MQLHRLRHLSDLRRIEHMFGSLGQPVGSLGDAELTARLREIHALRARLEVEELETLAEWDRRRVWAADGSRSAGARLARETGMAQSTARERVRIASALRRHEIVRSSFRDGRLGWSTVRVLLSVVNECFQRDEALLVEQAERLSVEHLAIALRHWERLVDDDGANASDDAMRERAFLDLAQSWGGEGFLKGRLDPESLAIVKGELDARSDELYRTAKASIPAAAAAGATVVPARPLVVLNVDVEHHDGFDELRGRLADGSPISHDEVRRACCDTGLMRAVTKGGSVPIDLGRTSRQPSEGQRRFLASLWPTCAFPGCDLPYAWTELHHIRWWDEHDGPTDLDNLVPQCSFHHHQCHRGVFSVERTAADSIEFRARDGTLIGLANPTLPEILAPLRRLARAG
jgi:hypothetical protein